ncbi:ADP-ribosylation factor-like protein 14 [Thomomys bottae]
MGQLSSRNRDVQQVHVVLLGLDWAGKSTLLYQLKQAQAVTTSPTIGFNVEMIQVGRSPLLTVWDIGGQEKMRPTWGLHCQEADGLVFVVDSSDQRRLAAAREELRHVLMDEHTRHVPVLILANKQDLPGALSAEEVARAFRMSRLCGDRSWYVQPCCAVTGEGLAEGFGRLVALLPGGRQSRGAADSFQQK